MTFESLVIGQCAAMSRTVTEADVVNFAGISGDMNPAHLDAVWAASGPFGARVAHGMLTASFISALLGMVLPGPGAIYLGQTLRFKAPVRIGDTITTRAEVTGLRPERRRATLRTTCHNQDGTLVLDGEAEVQC
jgi:3-hydroxybutyryl-CoA dehydratase